MSNKRKYASWLVWLGPYLLSIVLTLVVGRIVANHALSFFELLALTGSVSSVFGIVVMIVQFKSVKKTTEETKQKIDNVSFVYELSKATALLRSTCEDIERDDITLASHKLRQIKDIVIRTKANSAGDKESERAIKGLNSFISLLNQQALMSEHCDFDKIGMMEGIEKIADSLNKRINEHMNLI